MKLLIVDAFTNRPFAGNPAADCLPPIGMTTHESYWMIPRQSGGNA